MLKILGIIAVILVIGIGGVLAYATTQPDEFRVQRSASIKAPPEKIVAQINDLRAMSAWSPYERKDPAMKRAYSGAPTGKGQVYEWDGDKNVGKGRISIADATPSKVTLNLDMLSPFEAHNIVEFTLQPQGDATNVTTNVTWAMRGAMPFPAKVMCLFFNMDRMVGGDFEAGLTSLKAIAEK